MSNQLSKLLDHVRNLIHRRHTGPKTERAYVGYIRDYILFHTKRHPREMGVDEIRSYLTYLAIDKNVAASTQNVAFNALLFLYKQVLGIELQPIESVFRARRHHCSESTFSVCNDGGAMARKILAKRQTVGGRARKRMLSHPLAAGAFMCFLLLPASAQQSDSKAGPVVVQPGAPGQPTRVLPSSTRATLPPRSPKDVEFMQGMIMHHAQAVEMTALMETHTENKELRLLGARISQSQSDEMNFMKRWLETRGESTSIQMSNMPQVDSIMHMPGMDMSSHHMMPGMLTPKQMDALKKAKGSEFDRLFLTGMIQHHNGALVMVKDLFDTAGAGQDAEVFNFTTDVDSGQRAEIRIMETMLRKNP